MKKNDKKNIYRSIKDESLSTAQLTGGLDNHFDCGYYLVEINNKDRLELGLPVEKCGHEHYVKAHLFVTDSGNEDRLQKNRVIGQTLVLSQCDDGKTSIYSRSYSSIGDGYKWSLWSKAQQDVQVGQVTSLDCFTSSGLYSGVYSVAGRSPETFVLTVIDNSTVAIASSKTRSISQFKYAVNVDGTFSYKTRVGSGDGKIEWGCWVDLGAADTTDIQDNSITAQKLSNDVREKVELVASLCEMTNDALQADTVHMVSGVDNIHFCGRSMDGNDAISVEIPAATYGTAGVMSAGDKCNLYKIVAIEFVRALPRVINPITGVFSSVDNAGYLGVIPVRAGERYLYSGIANLYCAGVAAYDVNRAYLYPIICNVDAALIKKDICVDEPFTIPEGVAYIAVSTRYQESNPVSIKKVYSPSEYADRGTSQLASYDVVEGYTLNTATGATAASANCAATDFIKVFEGDEFFVTAKWGSQSGIAGYDENKAFTKRLADATLTTFYSAAEVRDYLVRIPKGISYIKVSTSDKMAYPLKVAKKVSTDELAADIPFYQNQLSYAWFGDSISQYGLPEYVEKKLCSPILDCSFAGAPLTYSQDMYQGTGFMTIASCIKSGDYTPIENALQAQSDAGADITAKLVNLQHIKDANWNAISHFVVLAGTNDLSFSATKIDNIKVGLRQAFQDVISAYPHITIYVVSPPFRGNINSSVNGLNLLEINNAIEEVCEEFNFPFFDFFHNCGVNQYNKAHYLDAQELHPNANGLRLWSMKLANWLKSL